MFFEALARGLDRLTAGLSAALIFAALGVFLFGMGARALAPSLSGGWIEEITIYMVIWAAMLATATAAGHREHVRMDAVLNLLPLRERRALDVLGSLAAFAYCAALAWFGWLTVEFAMRIGERGPSVLRLPMGWYYASLPCGIGLCAARILIRAVLLARRSASDNPAGPPPEPGV